MIQKCIPHKSLKMIHSKYSSIQIIKIYIPHESLKILILVVKNNILIVKIYDMKIDINILLHYIYIYIY